METAHATRCLSLLLHTTCIIVYILTFDNEFLAIFNLFFRYRQNVFLIIFTGSTYFVIKCATKVLKIS